MNKLTILFVVAASVFATEKMFAQGKGTYVYLKTNHGRWVSVEPDGTVIANRKVPFGWERFEVIKHEEGLVSFKTSHGKFLKFIPNDRPRKEKPGSVVGGASTIKGWEKIRVIKTSPKGHFAFQTTFDGKEFLCALPSAEAAESVNYKFRKREKPYCLMVNRNKIDGWEKFQVYIEKDDHKLFPGAKKMIKKSPKQVLEDYLSARLKIGNQGSAKVEKLKLRGTKVRFKIKVIAEHSFGKFSGKSPLRAEVTVDGEYDHLKQEQIEKTVIKVKVPKAFRVIVGKKYIETTIGEIADYLVGRGDGT